MVYPCLFVGSVRWVEETGGGGDWGTVLYTVRGVGFWSRDVDVWRANALYAEGRGLQVPIGLEHGNIVGTQCCDTLSRAS